jgi:RNA polymerase sigma factor (sigma-70 family)
VPDKPFKQQSLQQQEAGKEFEQQVRMHEALLHKVCRLYAHTDADRQDLFQEIVIQLWRSYPKFRGEAKRSTWMYRVALNTAITGLRRKKDFINSYDPATLPAHLADDNSALLKEEKLQEMHVAIARLNEVERAIVMLYMEDKSYEEMEEILGMTQGNLRVKMTRIKEKLRQLTKS